MPVAPRPGKRRYAQEPRLQLLLSFLIGCGPVSSGPSVIDEPESTDIAHRPQPRAASGWALASHPQAMHDVEVPDSVRPANEEAQASFRPKGHFMYRGNTRNTDIYAIPLPVHSNLLSTRLKGTHSFGSGSPPDFSLATPDGPFRFERGAKARGSFGFTRDHLLVGVASGTQAPLASDFQITFPTAAERENALNLSSSGLSVEDFTLRSLNIDRTTHAGVFLPAPGSATWTVPVPANGVLTFKANVLPPVIVSEVTSDGATVVVEVLGDGEPTEVHRADLDVDAWSPQRLSLSPWAGQTVELRIRTETGERGDFDYVFLSDPTVYTPSQTPRRVMLVFVDTLRPDHMSLYGYARPTTPTLDAWAGQGTVFEGARTVAPWTLPSARSALSGRQPEDWYDEQNLPEILSAAGYHTEAIVANAFLSEPFDMDRGWSEYSYQHLLEAPDVVRTAKAVIDSYPDRDLFMMVHFMDPHLPYDEPRPYKKMFAGPKPESLRAVSRRELVKIDAKHPDFSEIRQHVIDRYDQNIRMVDDALLPLLDAAGRDATVVLFSDHGEEFWEHGYFEHGHNFHDELLNIPLVIRSPKLPAGRIQAPTSILDIAPTVLEIEGIGHTIDGAHSLVPLAFGDADARAPLEARGQAFGRPLYFGDGWAVLQGGKKWISRYGEQKLFDLGADAAETKNIAAATELSGYPEALQKALGREVKRGWRLSLTTARRHRDVSVKVTHPDGIAAAWRGYDPRGRTDGTTMTVTDGILQIAQPSGAEMPDEIFVVPAGTANRPTGLTVELTAHEVSLVEAILDDQDLQATRTPLLSVEDSGVRIEIDFAVVPMPGGVEVSAYHEDMDAQLRALGYVEDETEDDEIPKP